MKEGFTDFLLGETIVQATARVSRKLLFMASYRDNALQVSQF